jgi:hypothetical protein
MTTSPGPFVLTFHIDPLWVEWVEVETEMFTFFDRLCDVCQWLGVADAYVYRAIRKTERARLTCRHAEPESGDCPATRCDACQRRYDRAKTALREGEERAQVVREAFLGVACCCSDAR